MPVAQVSKWSSTVSASKPVWFNCPSRPCLVNEAIQAGDIAHSENHTADTIVFGFWSMLYGGMLLAQSDIPLEDLGFSPVIKMLWNNSQRLMDAYGWKPLSTRADTDELFTEICSALFAEEVCRLTQGENHHD